MNIQFHCPQCGRIENIATAVHTFPSYSKAVTVICSTCTEGK
jgi:transcription elongation factor Elf1